MTKSGNRIGRLTGLALLALAVPAAAQTAPGIKEIPAPTLRGEIPLKTVSGAPATAPEGWVQFGDTKVLHNVSRPTLIPFLPAPAKSTGAAVVIAPGGGFMMLSMYSEGIDVARWLQSQGIAAFVLKYRLLPTPASPGSFARAMIASMSGAGKGPQADGNTIKGVTLATEDAREAMKLVRSRAREWRIDPDRVGFMGFSAGAGTALALALTGDEASRPGFIAPIYGPMGAPFAPVPASPPPIWAALSSDDPLLGKTDFALINAWRDKGGTIEFHLYEKGGHGWGFSGKPDTTTMLWRQEFLAWLQSRKFLARSK